jgi:ABC-type uncharacterized transport system permease subunit
VAVLFGGFGSAGSLLQRRMGVPDASILVLEGFAFLLILASEALRGRLLVPIALPARTLKALPAAAGGSAPNAAAPLDDAAPAARATEIAA